MTGKASVGTVSMRSEAAAVDRGDVMRESVQMYLTWTRGGLAIGAGWLMLKGYDSRRFLGPRGFFFRKTSHLQSEDGFLNN